MGICDQKTFEKIYSEWSRPLQIFLQGRGLDKGIAADKTQESFIKLWNNCKKVSIEKAKSFLYTVAANLQIDEFRKSKVRLNFKKNVSSSIHYSDGQYEMEMAEFKSKLEQTLDTMNPNSKLVFMMNRFEELSYREIAERLDISVKAVEKRMSKALAHMYQQNILKKR